MAKLETISETTRPAPWRLAWRRTNQLPIPASGASTTRFGIAIPPSRQGSVRDRDIGFHGTNPAMNLFDELRPWAEVVLDQVPGLQLFDAHTHLGQNDPDGMKQSGPELVAGLTAAGARGCFVFPFHEPDGGYSAANDDVLAAASNGDGLLVPFCRVNPHDSPVPEAERSLAAGARGIKLHPR